MTDTTTRPGRAVLSERRASPARAIGRLAVPMAFADVVGVLTPMCVAAMMGRMVGDEAFYVRSLFMPIEFLFVALQVGVGMSTQVAVALRQGRGRPEEMVPVAASIARVGAAVGAVLSLVLLLGGPTIAGLLDVEGHARGEFLLFLAWVGPASTLLIGPAICAAVLRASGQAKAGAVVTLSAAAVELAGVALFGFVADMGVQGVPLSLAVSGVFGTVLGLVLLRRSGLWQPKQRLPWQRDAVEHLTSVGIPIAVSYVVMFASNLALLWVVTPFGASVQAGFSGAATLQTVIIMPGLVLGSATAIVMNEQRGAGRQERLGGIVKAGLGITAALYALISLTVWLGRDQLAAFMTGNDEIVAATSRYLEIVGLTYLCMGLVLAVVTIMEQIGAGLIALVLNAVYFVGLCVVGGMMARAQDQPEGLYTTIAVFNIGGLVCVPFALLFVRRLMRKEAEAKAAGAAGESRSGETAGTDEAAATAEAAGTAGDAGEVTRHTVAFRVPGPAPEPAPLTWGQQQIWRDIQWMLPDTAFFNVSQAGELPEGVGVLDVLDAVGRLAARHASLRTLFPSDGGAHPSQHVLTSGEVEVEVVRFDSDPDVDPVQRFREAEARLVGRGFDAAADVPLRAQIGVLDGQPRAVVLCASHLAVDLLSARLLMDELLDSLTRGLLGEPEPEPPVYRTLVEQSAHERSERGARQLDRSLRYWREQLESVPPTMFPEPGDPAEPRFWRGGLTSRAVPAAARILADRHRVSTSVVLLAATAALLGRISGAPVAAVQLVVGNRFDPRLRDAVGSLTQEVLTTIDLRADSYRELLRSTWSATLKAYRHGQADPARTRALVAEAEAERGVALDIGCYFNDLWSMLPQALSGEETASEPSGTQGLRESMEESVFAWEEYLERDNVRFFLEVFDVFREPGLVRLSLHADTGVLPPDALRDFLYELERTLVDSACGEDDPGRAGRTGTTGQPDQDQPGQPDQPGQTSQAGPGEDVLMDGPAVDGAHAG